MDGLHVTCIYLLIQGKERVSTSERTINVHVVTFVEVKSELSSSMAAQMTDV